MIKIVTVYNSLNPGSFLQATALYQVLSEKYNDVSFQYRKKNTYLGSTKLSLKLLSKFKINMALNQFKMPFVYKKELSKYCISKGINNDDIYVIGSDEIWNISKKAFLKNDVFFGIGLNKKNCISYAPSINNATYEDFKTNNHIIKAINEIYAISVRDEYSKKTIEKFVEREIIVNIDPTMLIDISSYRNKQKKIKYKDYIFVYGPERFFSKKEIQVIKQYAKKEGKKIISYYFYHDWCDEIVYGSPYDFTALIDNASLVLTGTFHGVVFSILFNKKFLVFGKNKKVQELLKQFELDVEYSNRHDFEKIKEKDYKYDNINNEINNMRLLGKSFLFDNIENIISNNKN